MAGKTIKTDVLVVGGGGAGFRAAIGAREKGSKNLDRCSSQSLATQG